jgi:chloramphenicol 3-O-phosphotransferase
MRIISKMGIAMLVLIPQLISSQKAGAIIILNGTSSAGKTSILKEVEQMYAKPHIIINSDLFFDTYVQTDPIPMRESEKDCEASHKQKISAWVQRSSTALYNQAKRYADEGKDVFVDTVEFDTHYDYYSTLFKQHSILKVAAYCPLDVIIERVEKRNKSGDPQEKRSLKQAVVQFLGMFAVQQSANEMVVDCVNTACLLCVLQQTKIELEQRQKEDLTISSNDFEKLENKLLIPFINQFQLHEDKEIVLVAQHSWDLAINTAQQNPKENAQIIINALNAH